jgi:hypothetical protein
MKSEPDVPAYTGRLGFTAGRRLEVPDQPGQLADRAGPDGSVETLLQLLQSQLAGGGAQALDRPLAVPSGRQAPQGLGCHARQYRPFCAGSATWRRPVGDAVRYPVVAPKKARIRGS